MAITTTPGRGAGNATHGEILQIIRHSSDVSRSDISRETGLALSTTSLRVDALIKHRLVTESGRRASRGGRRAIGLRIDPAAGRFGIMLVAPKHSEVRVVDFSGTPVATAPMPELDLSRPSEAMHAMWKELVGLLPPGELSPDDLACVCVVVGGPVQFSTGAVVSPATMPGWHGVSVTDLMSELTSVPVLVENLSNLEAMAEFAATDRRVTQLMSVGLGDYIGCGLVVNGELYRGASGAAGEIGHSSVPATAVVPCTCSAPNCLEASASGRAIAFLMKQAGLQVDSIADVVRHGNGDSLAAIDIVRQAGRVIGTSLVSAVNFFNPNEIVLSGPLSACVPLVRSLQAVVLEQALPLNTADLTIRESTVGDQAALLGAANLSLTYLLSVERIDSLIS